METTRAPYSFLACTRPLFESLNIRILRIFRIFVTLRCHAIVAGKRFGAETRSGRSEVITVELKAPWRSLARAGKAPPGDGSPEPHLIGGRRCFTRVKTEKGLQTACMAGCRRIPIGETAIQCRKLSHVLYATRKKSSCFVTVLVPDDTLDV